MTHGAETVRCSHLSAWHVVLRSTSVHRPISATEPDALYQPEPNVLCRVKLAIKGGACWMEHLHMFAKMATVVQTKTLKHAFHISRFSGIWISDKVLSSSTVRPSVSYLDFSGQTSGPIRLKFGSRVPLLTGIKRELQTLFRSGDFKQVKMADVQFPSKIFSSRPISQKRYQIWISTLTQNRDVKLRRSCRSHDWKCVKMAVA